MKVAPLVARDASGDVSPNALLQAVNTGNPSKGLPLAAILESWRGLVKRFSNPFLTLEQRSVRSISSYLRNPMRAIPGALGGVSVPVQSLLNSNAGQTYLKRGLLDVTPGMARVGDVTQRDILLPLAIQTGLLTTRGR